MAPQSARVSAVAAAAVVDDVQHPRRLLAARRSAPIQLAGRWELPGGKVEAGESAREAVCRELAEELGVTIEVGGPVSGPLTHPPGGWVLRPGLTMQVWWARISRGVPEPLQDHDALRWVSRQEIQTLNWLPSNTAITAYLVARMHD